MLVIVGLAALWTPYFKIYYENGQRCCYCRECSLLVLASTGTLALLIFLICFFIRAWPTLENYYNYYEVDKTVTYKKYHEYECCSLSSCETSDDSLLYTCSNALAILNNTVCNMMNQCTDYSSSYDCDCDLQFSEINNQYEEYCSTCIECEAYRNTTCTSTCGTCYSSTVDISYTINGHTGHDYHVDTCTMNNWECANELISEYTLGDTTTQYYYPFDDNWRDEPRDLTFPDNCRYNTTSIYVSRCKPDYYASIIVPAILYIGHILAIIITATVCGG